MIAVSATILTNKSIVAKFMTRSLQIPLREIYKDSFTRNLWSTFTQTPLESAFHSIKIESYKWTKNLKFAKNIIRSPCMKPKKSASVPKKPLILLSAGSFLGYHKDGKRRRIFQPDTDSLAQRQQDAARTSEINRKIRNKTLLGRILAVYVWLTEMVFVVFRTIQLGIYFLPLVLSAPIARYNHWFRVKIWYEMLVKILEQSGPIFVKMGQWASTRKDLFPDEVCEILTKLQRYAKTHPWSHTQKTLEASLGPLWYIKFEDFETRPIGSGACAQVYNATINTSKLKRNEDFESLESEVLPVAVKVLHPNIVCKFERDLGVFQFLVDMAYTFMPSIEWVSFRESLDEFAFQMQVQLDLTTEAENMLQFGKDYEKSNVIFPKPIIELCTPELLVQTFEKGEHIQNYLSNLTAIPEAARKKMSDLGADLLLSMVFQNNFVHGDLHPGNILVRGSLKNPEQIKIVVLDSGMVATLTHHDFRNLHDTFKAVIKGNGREVGQLFLERSPMSHCKDPERFINEIEEIVTEARKERVTFDNTEVAQLLMRVFNTLRDNKVKLDANFAAVILSIMVIEGLARQLDPDMDLITKAAPYLLRSYFNTTRRKVARNLESNEKPLNILEEQDFVFT